MLCDGGSGNETETSYGLLAVGTNAVETFLFLVETFFRAAICLQVGTFFAQVIFFLVETSSPVGIFALGIF